ncbi:MAG TPA: hypothetical protein VFY29_04430 [Terriglobia bacterium]|nr:hypothetical protein [Terriglobia bacterium]
MNFYRCVLIGFTCFVMSGCHGSNRALHSITRFFAQHADLDRPKIIELFACSDYCPGPWEQYLVKAYEGIDNEFDCLRLGGTPHEYFGWGKQFVCLAEPIKG